MNIVLDTHVLVACLLSKALPIDPMSIKEEQVCYLFSPFVS